MNEALLRKDPILYSEVLAMPDPLVTLNDRRTEILKDVVQKTTQEVSQTKLEFLLGEALYSEKQRLKRFKPNVFTKWRKDNDSKLWGQVQRELILPPGELDRQQVLTQVLGHYAEEIGGHFDPRVYWLAVRAVPWFFNWLLNAAHFDRFMPWKAEPALNSSIEITGHIEHLQRLSKKGTLLLVPTHQSNIDSVLIGYVIYLMQLPPFAYGAGLNLFSNPVLSFFMGRLGAYTVDRQKQNQLYKLALKNYSTSILKQGVHSIFFPGGGRSRSGAIEDKLKLGLLGTALDAQIYNLKAGRPNPNLYIVPMVMSYHFVLEAGSLIEDFLALEGKSRFLIPGDESWQIKKVAQFFWKFFAVQSSVTVRLGQPLDVFGNFVDEEGHSIGPNRTRIDPKQWLTTRGELKAEPKRDREYTAELGSRLVDRYHAENTVLSSHWVAFSFMKALRAEYPTLDLYRFLRLTEAQRMVSREKFFAQLERDWHWLCDLEKKEKLNLHPSLRVGNFDQALAVALKQGIDNLGCLHDAKIVKPVGEEYFGSDDLSLLYYYRNRLAGYSNKGPGKNDSFGFLA